MFAGGATANPTGYRAEPAVLEQSPQQHAGTGYREDDKDARERKLRPYPGEAGGDPRPPREPLMHGWPSARRGVQSARRAGARPARTPGTRSAAATGPTRSTSSASSAQGGSTTRDR